jgi:NAD+ synthase (glutamine-hydrolysing)
MRRFFGLRSHPTAAYQSLAGSQLIFNLSASNELIGKHNYRKQLITQQSARCIAGYVYVSSGFGESSTDLLFSGNAIVCENGTILAENERFSLKKQLVINEIDIERLSIDRQKTVALMQGLSLKKATIILEQWHSKCLFTNACIKPRCIPVSIYPTGLS